MNSVRVRFAPSPTGPLHAGAARTALGNWLYARGRGGRILLRFDDTDVERSSGEWEPLIVEDLEWLGIDWDEGPVRQSERAVRYAEALAQLPTVIRDGAHEFAGRIIARPDGSALYHLATAVDEIDDKITHVLRGRDHLDNTILQRAIIEALGERPPEYVHVPLMTLPGGEKLSKREAAGDAGDSGSTIAHLRECGYPPVAVANALALSLADFGTEEVMTTLDDAAARFDLDHLHTADSQFDFDKLRWLSGQQIRAMSDDALAAELAERGAPGLSGVVLEAARTGGSTLLECADTARHLIDPPEPDDAARDLMSTDDAAAAIALLCGLADEPPATLRDAEELFGTIKAELRARDLRLGPALRGLRAALTGRTDGPEMRYVLTTMSGARLRSLCGRG